jgi:hypothetical protein
MPRELARYPIRVGGCFFNPKVVVLAAAAQLETENFGNLEIGRPVANRRGKKGRAIGVGPLRKRAWG